MFANACTDVKVRSLLRFGTQGADGEFYELTLEHPGSASTAWQNWKPGQFVMVRPTAWEHNPLWGRPFSIHKADGDTLSVFFQVIGRGTRGLARLAPGDEVTVWGPLGNAFAVRDDRPTLVLAGGIGIAPFYEYLRRHPSPEKLRLVFGHRPPAESYPLGIMEKYVKCEAYREKGPEDLKAFIGLLGDIVPEYATDGHIVACGPLPFLKTIQTIAAEAGGRAQLSLENRMACGVGACLGCVCEHKDSGPVSVCARGPVFWSDEITF